LLQVIPHEEGRDFVKAKTEVKSTPDLGLFGCPNKDLVFHAHQGHLYNSHCMAERAIRLLHQHLNCMIFSGLVRHISTCLIPPTLILVTPQKSIADKKVLDSACFHCVGAQAGPGEKPQEPEEPEATGTFSTPRRNALVRRAGSGKGT